MTTTSAAVENTEKTITNKIAGGNLLKLIHRHRKVMKSKEEECHEIKAIENELKIGRGGEKDVIKDWSLGIQAELAKYEKVVEELQELEQKLRKQAARETQEKEKAKLDIKKKFEAKTIEKASNADKLNVTLPKLVITKFHGTHLDWHRFWGQVKTTIDKSDIGQVAKVSYSCTCKNYYYQQLELSSMGCPLTVRNTHQLRTFP